MGANQSSKNQQLGLAVGNGQKPLKSSSSLRKSIMGNVLSAGKKSSNNSETIQKKHQVVAKNADDDDELNEAGLLYDNPEMRSANSGSYYVASLNTMKSPNEANENSRAAVKAAKVSKSKSKSKSKSSTSKTSKTFPVLPKSLNNNYVTMQQQHEQLQLQQQQTGVQLSVDLPAFKQVNRAAYYNEAQEQQNSSSTNANSAPIIRMAQHNTTGYNKFHSNDSKQYPLRTTVELSDAAGASFSANNRANHHHHHPFYAQQSGFSGADGSRLAGVVRGGKHEQEQHYASATAAARLVCEQQNLLPAPATSAGRSAALFTEHSSSPQTKAPLQLSSAANSASCVAMPVRVASGTRDELTSSYVSQQQEQFYTFYQQQALRSAAPVQVTANQEQLESTENNRFYARNLLDFGAGAGERLPGGTHNSFGNPIYYCADSGSPVKLTHQQSAHLLGNYSSSGLKFASKTLESSAKKQHKEKNSPQQLLFQVVQASNTTGSQQQYPYSGASTGGRRATIVGNKCSLSARRTSCPNSLKRIKSGPSLSAQQASYEAMRTIDMYLIRQIAHSCMDFEMEQKIDLEIRLRELAAQSMLEARTEIDVLEVEKSLLTSDQRMNCYASQLEQQRKQLSNPSISTDSGRGSKSGQNLLSHRRHRSDVIGQSASSTGRGTTTGALGGTGSTGEASASPSFSSLSNSRSPSKLSPVSGESANSEQPSFTSSHSHSRTGYHNRANSSNNNTLSAKQKSKNRKRQQLIQSITHLSNINCNMVLNNRASVSLSEIRIPLMWKDVDHFKGRGDYKRFAIFCLLKIDSQIYDTQLISDVDRHVTDVTFDDVVVFNEIDHSFELTLEVYSCVYLEQFSFSSTPRKLKEKLTNSVSRAMGRRLATQTASIHYTKELQAYDKSYRFAMIASAILKLEDASDSVKTYDLVLVSPEAHHRQHPSSTMNTVGSLSYSKTHDTSSYTYSHNHHHHNGNNKEANKNTLPLFGHICCKLYVKPDVYDKNIRSGYLRVATISVPAANGSNNNISSSSPSSSPDDHHSTQQASLSSKMATLSMSSSTVHWALLRNFSLHLWPVDEIKLNAALARGHLPQLDHPRIPPISVGINKFTRLLRVSNSSITLETDKICLVLGLYSQPEQLGLGSDEIGLWLRAIEQLIYDSHIWGSVLNHHQTISSANKGGSCVDNHNFKSTSSLLM